MATSLSRVNAQIAKLQRQADALRAKSKTKGVIKYHDNAGNSWTGHGRAPSWYKSAIAPGKTQADLLVN